MILTVPKDFNPPPGYHVEFDFSPGVAKSDQVMMIRLRDRSRIPLRFSEAADPISKEELDVYFPSAKIEDSPAPDFEG